MAQALSAEQSYGNQMRGFIMIWLGQVVSIHGTHLTAFALGVWIYQHTGSVTQYSLIILCSELPSILLSPIVGAIVDRSDRRLLMILSNVGAGLCTLTLSLLSLHGWLTLWLICILMTFLSTCEAFLRPAFSASVSLLVPKRHLGRASGMVQTGQAVAQILSPLLAGVLIIVIQIQGVLVIDFFTYLVAICSLLLVRIPSPEVTGETIGGKGSLMREAAFGWTYIMARPGIFALLCFFAVTNFAVTMSNILITPLVLSFANAAVYGTVLSVTGVGVLAGGLVMSLWGGPKHRIYGVFFYGVVQGTSLILQGLRPNAVLIAAALFCAAFSAPIVSGCFVPIIQSKTPPDVQGRVFAAMRMVSWCSVPVAYLLAGPLSDRVFEPLMATDGALAGSLGLIIGTGTGRGIGLLFSALGIVMLLATLRIYLYPRVRNIEGEMSDKLPEATIAAEG
jgi:DHA3 family macrolide efflux protein-like MFS transporter